MHKTKSVRAVQVLFSKNVERVVTKITIIGRNRQDSGPKSLNGPEKLLNSRQALRIRE